MSASATTVPSPCPAAWPMTASCSFTWKRCPADGQQDRAASKATDAPLANSLCCELRRSPRPARPSGWPPALAWIDGLKPGDEALLNLPSSAGSWISWKAFLLPGFLPRFFQANFIISPKNRNPMTRSIDRRIRRSRFDFVPTPKNCRHIWPSRCAARGKRLGFALSKLDQSQLGHSMTTVAHFRKLKRIFIQGNNYVFVSAY